VQEKEFLKLVNIWRRYAERFEPGKARWWPHWPPDNL